jgi:hypothetical protein
MKILITLLLLAIAGIAWGATLQKNELPDPVRVNIDTKDKWLKLVEEYKPHKKELIERYERQGYFTSNEWQNFISIMNAEAKAGNLKSLETKNDLISKVIERIK